MMSLDLDTKSDSEVEERDRSHPVILQSPRGMPGDGHLVRAQSHLPACAARNMGSGILNLELCSLKSHKYLGTPDIKQAQCKAPDVNGRQDPVHELSTQRASLRRSGSLPMHLVLFINVK